MPKQQHGSPSVPLTEVSSGFEPIAVLCAGIPAQSATLYHAIRFSVGDPAALLTLRRIGGGTHRVLLIRDIELERARSTARADAFHAPAAFTPARGLSGNRETATAQAAAECLRRSGVRQVQIDRSTPSVYWHALVEAGIDVSCDLDSSVARRRTKDAQEIAWLRQCQADTEVAVRLACELVARSHAAADGTLMHGSEPLTSELVRRAIDACLLERGYQNPESIVAGGAMGSDCHAHGHGPLRTGEPVIIDIFPRQRQSMYHGDCTRTVVHGAVSPDIARMHAAVAAAKHAALVTVRAGVTGECVHAATARAIEAAGFLMGLPSSTDHWNDARMTHGTGHGIGLEVHEPPLLAHQGPPLVVGDVVTVEPGLYHPRIGGIRIEDMVVVTEDGFENLGSLPEGLNWK
ncbi:MAG: aminopeptidase P family protein [Planctomycetes bacterium]|nr:aminopeptidase P family protein [Planctomycetota bacterium]